MNKVKLTILLEALLLFILAWVCINGNSTAVAACGMFMLMLAVLILLFSMGLGYWIPIPSRLKVFLLMAVFLKLTRMLSFLMRTDKNDIIKYFIEISNKLYKRLKGKVLVLLPKCIQNSECGQDIITDIKNCIACGKCQALDIIKLTDKPDISLCLVGGGRLALEKIEEVNPDSVIAVACEVELFEGICAVYKKPVIAVINNRPNGPCLNTDVTISDFTAVINQCIR